MQKVQFISPKQLYTVSFIAKGTLEYAVWSHNSFGLYDCYISYIEGQSTFWSEELVDGG